VEGVGDEVLIGGLEGEGGEARGVAGEEGGKGGVDPEAGGAKEADGLEALRDRGAMRLEATTDSVVVGRDAEADAEAGDDLEQGKIAEEEGTAGLEDEDLGRGGGDGLENCRHELSGGFGGLVGVGEGGAVDGLMGAEFAGEEEGGVGLEGRVVAPVVPVVVFETGLDAHGGDVAIGAAEGAVAGGGERVGEAGGKQKAGRP